MSRTLGATIKDARARLDERTQGRWLDEELRRWSNDAQRDIARRVPWNRSSGTISAVAGTQEYNLPSTALIVDRVAYVESGATTRYDLQRIDFNTAAERFGGSGWENEGTPRYFWTWGSPGSAHTLALWPTPSAAGTITVHYTAIPADLADSGSADSSNVAVPEGYEEAVVTFIVYNALLADADARWTEYKTLYEHQVASLEEAATRGFVSQPSYVMGGGGLGGVPFGWEDW